MVALCYDGNMEQHEETNQQPLPLQVPEMRPPVDEANRDAPCTVPLVQAAEVGQDGARATFRNSPESSCWAAMIQRCCNPNNPAFSQYGGRGITVCGRWRDSFRDFLADVGRRPSLDYSLDRINNDGNYEQGNVRWATRKEQGQNTRANWVIEYRGKATVVSELLAISVVSKNALYNRLRRGWGVEAALTTPQMPRGSSTQRTARWAKAREAKEKA